MVKAKCNVTSKWTVKLNYRSGTGKTLEKRKENKIKTKGKDFKE